MNATLPQPFSDTDTSLKMLIDAGWKIRHSSGGSWWFEKGLFRQEGFERVSVPRWIAELVIAARNAGMSSVQYQLRELIDNEEPRYLGPCVPFMPAAKEA